LNKFNDDDDEKKHYSRAFVIYHIFNHSSLFA